MEKICLTTRGWRLITVILVLLAVGMPLAINALAAETKTPSGLIAHWPLAEDAKDAVGHLHGKPENIQFSNGSAAFNGRDSLVRVADAEQLHLGTGDFSIGLWVQCEVPLQSTLGDLFSKFDPINRRGINFHLSGSSSGYGAMCDTRHVHFGIDDGYMSDWEDCGKPSSSNTLITRLTVFDGNLYCGIADAENLEDAARIFRYAGGSKWIDCGRLGEDPNHHSVQSLIVHQGKLYAGTGIWDWVQARGRLRGRPAAAMTRVFVYEGGTKWRDLGQVGDGTRVMCMASFDGELYAGLDSSPRINRGGGRAYRYDGKKWIDCGAPDGRNFESLLPLNGKLYASTHGNVYQYEGGQSWKMIGDAPFGISQIHSMEAVNGKIVIGTWPQGYVLRYENDGKWSNMGRLGLPEGQPKINEINDLTVYNGKLYAGVLPLSEVYRYEEDNKWTRLAQLGQRPDWDAKNPDTWLRLTCMTSFQGKLFAGTGTCFARADTDADSSLGRVYALQSGQVVSHEHDIGGDWAHLVAVRHGQNISLYVDGKLSNSTLSECNAGFNLTNHVPLQIGFGQQNHFHGKMRDLRLYGRALGKEEIRLLHRESTPHRKP
jgi:hypothetical protein